jgi:hypothetical protein
VSKVWVASEQDNGVGLDLLNEVHGIDSHEEIDICFIVIVA